MIAVPALRMMAFTSAKSVLISPGTVIRSVTPRTAESSTSSAILKASSIEVSAAVTESSRSFGMTMSVSTFSRSDWMPFSAWVARRLPSKENGRVTTPIVKIPSRARDLGDDRGGAGTGAAALAGGDEDHVGLHQGLFDLGAVVLGGLTADLGVAAGAEALGQLATDVEFEIGFAHQQGLGVSVGRDEFDVAKSRGDHAIHCVHAASTDADDFDHGVVIVLIETHELPLG